MKCAQRAQAASRRDTSTTLGMTTGVDPFTFSPFHLFTYRLSMNVLVVRNDFSATEPQKS